VPDCCLDGFEQQLCEVTSKLFKALAHPARILVLEILSAATAPVAVSAILAETKLEATLLSQHFAVLKRHHVVTSERAGNAVYYRLTHPKVSELLRVACAFLADTPNAADGAHTRPPCGVSDPGLNS
jgi:DNA-binding transcriptional ArsR family regulator